MRGLGDGRPKGAARDLLRARWGRWTAIVEAFAHRRPSRQWVDPSAYMALHRELLAECRAAAEATDPVGPADRQELELLVRPWLSTRTLAQADREILEGLLARCREIERQLGGRRWPLAVRAVAARLALPAVAVTGSCVLWALALTPGPTLEWVRDWSDVLWFIVRRSSDVQRLAVVAVIVVFVSIRIVSRTARS
jgi:hypothetical protein